MTSGAPNYKANANTESLRTMINTRNCGGDAVVLRTMTFPTYVRRYRCCQAYRHSVSTTEIMTEGGEHWKAMLKKAVAHSREQTRSSGATSGRRPATSAGREKAAVGREGFEN